MSTYSALLIPVILGTVGILQAGLNRTMSNEVGLTHAALLGNAITLICSCLLLFYIKINSDKLPSMFELKASISAFKWWYIIPGIFGFMFVIGLPWGIYKIGAVKVTVGLIAAQMIAGVLWDIFVEKIPVNTMKVMGMLSAGLSVVFITFSK
ncbi:DMT family transporter [Halobacteriovorax sp. GB3]|uniref:DMT family transporter n=1 Tax=Halobacteriovorax sp. GB3 TaxID=2719615 RepID=UPI00236142D5|nr:DMT family transporter [Halobacteriovorax sp. GB3]MDD0853714.1 DMT family transporter [Halobacteriovorax sp. GB3]